jgi:hypothetical protein
MRSIWRKITSISRPHLAHFTINFGTRPTLKHIDNLFYSGMQVGLGAAPFTYQT